MDANPLVADLFSWPRSELPTLVEGVGRRCKGMVVVVYVCATQLQSPSEVDSCQARSPTLRQGLTKRLNTALGFPASMVWVDRSVSEMCVFVCVALSKSRGCWQFRKAKKVVRLSDSKREVGLEEESLWERECHLWVEGLETETAHNKDVYRHLHNLICTHKHQTLTYTQY